MKKIALFLTAVFIAALAIYAQADAAVDSSYNSPLKYSNAATGSLKFISHKKHSHSAPVKGGHKTSITGEERENEEIQAIPVALKLNTRPNVIASVNTLINNTTYKEKTNLTILKTRK